MSVPGAPRRPDKRSAIRRECVVMPDGGFALSGLQIQRLLLSRHAGLISVAPSGANALLCRMAASPYPA
ncbi:TPA: hypothetical protein JD342_00995 [Citrobacter freundii]|nr:hypothetical protein [Citrobacter freundii]